MTELGGSVIRVGLDAHVIGRRKTGNEAYVVGVEGALAARDDVAVTAFLDAGMTWPAASPNGYRTPRTVPLLARDHAAASCWSSRCALGRLAPMSCTSSTSRRRCLVSP